MSRQSAEVIYWLAVAACAVAQLAILGAVFSPRQTDPVSTIPRSSRGTEILWAVIPAAGLAVLFAATWRAIH
jgi:hypothetical protein